MCSENSVPAYNESSAIGKVGHIHFSLWLKPFVTQLSLKDIRVGFNSLTSYITVAIAYKLSFARYFLPFAQEYIF